MSRHISAVQQRSSLFEIPSHRPTIVGSSITAFGIEPDEHHEHRREKRVLYENTYRMDPPIRFKSEKVNGIISEVLEANLAGKTSYDPIECSTLTKSISHEIKVKVKELDFKRYKIICCTTIGEKKDQDVRIGSRCVWDADRDNFSSASFENAHIFATAVVFAVYYE